jgi:hypothetical protein
MQDNFSFSSWGLIHLHKLIIMVNKASSVEWIHAKLLDQHCIVLAEVWAARLREDVGSRKCRRHQRSHTGPTQNVIK